MSVARVERVRGTAVPPHTLNERAAERAFHLNPQVSQNSNQMEIPPAQLRNSGLAVIESHA